MNKPKFPLNEGKKGDDDKNKKEMWEKQARTWVSYLLVNLIMLWFFQEFILQPLLIRETQIPYSEFKAKIVSGEIVEVTLGQERIVGTMKNPDATDETNEVIPFTTNAVPDGDPTLIPALDKAGVKYSVSEPPSPLGNFLLAYGLPWH
jgi:hypothetical protein